MRIERVVCQTRPYEPASTFTQTSAATAAARRTAALPVSVRRKLLSGVSRFRTQAVRPVNGVSRPAASLLLNRCTLSPDRLARKRRSADQDGTQPRPLGAKTRQHDA